MILSVGEVCGLKIYSLEDGEAKGEVVALTYDPREVRVKSVIVKSNGSIEDLGAIMIDQVVSFGVDAVIIGSKRQIIRLKEVREDLGEILKDTDARFDTKTGRVGTLKFPKFFSEIKDK